MTMATFTRVRPPSGFEYDEALLIQSKPHRSTYPSSPNIISKQTISRNSRRNHPSVQTGLNVDVRGYTTFVLPGLRLLRSFLVSIFPLQLSSPTHLQTVSITLIQL